MVETSLLIDHFRKTKRNASRLFKLIDKYALLVISSIAEYEVLVGSSNSKAMFWKELLAEFKIIPFDSVIVRFAVDVKNKLKRKSKAVEIADLFIAATAIAYSLSFDTLNKKHFIDIDELKPIDYDDESPDISATLI